MYTIFSTFGRVMRAFDLWLINADAIIGKHEEENNKVATMWTQENNKVLDCLNYFYSRDVVFYYNFNQWVVFR